MQHRVKGQGQASAEHPAGFGCPYGRGVEDDDGRHHYRCPCVWSHRGRASANQRRPSLLIETGDLLSTGRHGTVPPSPLELTPHVTPDTNPHVDGAADICRPCATAAAYAHVAATTRRECESAPGTHCTASSPLVRPKTGPMRMRKAHDQTQHPGSAAPEMHCASPQLLDCLDSRAPRGPMTRCCPRPLSILPIHARPIESAATICAGPLAFFVTALPNPTICP
jgi:hypothetical protein